MVSSMNSTRTWVTPPREPVRPRTPILIRNHGFLDFGGARERTSDLDKLDGLLCCVHFCRRGSRADERGLVV